MPAYVADYEHDLFVSYGCVDDQADDGQPGWVTVFLSDLHRRLSELLGRKDSFSIWRDEQALSRNVDLNTQIARGIESSACLLTVLSPGYLKSDWCQRERTEFLKWVRERNAAGGRIFLVERDWVKDGKPEEFRNLLGFKFWIGDPSSLSNPPRPLDKNRESDRDRYKDGINELARTIMAELSRLKAATSPGSTSVLCTPATAGATTVFLAEVTDDLRPQWKKVRTELDERGIHVVSGGPPRDGNLMEKEVAAALERSQLFVQLLSQVVGQPLAGARETYALLQHRLADKAEKRILQWRAPEVTEESFDEGDVDDPELTALHRNMLFGQVRAEHLADFKRRVIEVASEPQRRKTQPEGLRMVYVSFNPSSGDSKFGAEISEYLLENGFGVAMPAEAEDGDPDAIRADFEKSVLESKSWIVVYGDRKQKLWARGQLTEINKLLCEHKTHIAAIHLCAGPPAPKEVKNPLSLLGLHLPGMKVIDCQSGFEGKQFAEFLRSVAEKGPSESGNPPLASFGI